MSVAWLLAVSILAGGCVARDVTAIGVGGRPFQPEADEAVLWARAEKEQHSLLERATAYDDPLLDVYLAGVVDRLLPPAVPADGPRFTVSVLRDPTLNAFAMPNGRMFVHTGLLSRLANEAQLAAVLGRELAHVLHRHALQAHRAGRAEPAVSMGLEITSAALRARPRDPDGSAVLSRTAGAMLGLGLPLAVAASISGYGRTLERDADRVGMDALVRAGYDAAEAPRLFDALRDASRDLGPMEIFLLGSDPWLSERARTTRTLSLTPDPSGVGEESRPRDGADFAARMRAVVRDNAYEEIRAGRFTAARQQLGRVLAVTPQDPAVHLYYGDLYRLQSQRARTRWDQDDKAAKARAGYERALALDGAAAEPHRQLGLLHYQQHEAAHARAAFERYLAAAPDAPDAGRIKGYIEELDR